MNAKLIDVLIMAGMSVQTWVSPDDSAVLVLPHGGRILGLFTAGSDDNFFWTHPALQSVESARSFYQSEEWHNSGGDRTWLSPEVDFFMPEFPRTQPYFQPREFDPGCYKVSIEEDGLSLHTSFAAHLSRSTYSPQVELTKTLTSAANPLRHYKDPSISELKYAGYTLQTQLNLPDGPGRVQLNTWNLLQLPHGGDLVISTFSRTAITPYFGEVCLTDLEIKDHYILYRMHSTGEHKFGIQPATVTGRVGYVRKSGKTASLVIRNFLVNPSAEYIDVPWLTPDAPGSSIEVCNVNSVLGKFSELEYHAPAIGGATGLSASSDLSCTWAFAGPCDAIRTAVRILLGAQL